MNVSDPIADMLTRIRNASRARHTEVVVPASRTKREIARILKDEGFIADVSEGQEGPRLTLTLTLKYVDGKAPVVSGLKRVSKPGLRVYAAKGPKGQLQRTLHPDILVAQEDGRILVTRPDEDKFHRQLHGLTRTLVANMVEGVTNGYRKGIEITGVGYRAQKVGTKLQLNL